MDLFFDSGPRFSPADIEPFRDDPDRVRSAGRMLHDAAGGLDFAQRASEQLQELTQGVAWRGNAFHAFKAGIEKQPLPKHLVNARNVLGWTGDELARLAGVLDDIQQDVARLKNRADLLGVDGPVPEERRAEVEAIQREYDELKERREQAMDRAADVIDEMTDKTVFARPPKGFFGKIGSAFKSTVNFTKDFAAGVVEGTVEIGKGLVMIASLATPQGMYRAVNWVQQNRHMIGAAISYAMDDPLGMAKEVGKVLIDYDTLKENPGRWLGKLAPQIAIAVATAGVGGMASRSGAIATKGTEATGRFAQVAGKLETATRLVDTRFPGIGKFGDVAELTRGQAFKKGVYDSFVNKPMREVATGGLYGRAKRAHYLLHGRKELPMWGKVSKKVPVVTAAATRLAAQQEMVDDIAGVLDEGAAQAQRN